MTRRHPEVSDPQVNRSSSFPNSNPNSNPNLQFFKQCLKIQKPSSMITLSIIIYVASPLDYARYRHAALYLEYGEPPENSNTNANTEANANTDTNDTKTRLQPKSSVAEIVGSTGFFSFVERLNWEPPISSTGEAPPGNLQPANSSFRPTNPMQGPFRFCFVIVQCTAFLYYTAYTYTYTYTYAYAYASLCMPMKKLAVIL
jgi:hypothetical protein